MDIFKKFNIKVNDESLFETAFTHSSYANENNIESNERLEYLGDAVLELTMSHYLFVNKNLPEGKMTKLRAEYVCENALFEYSLSIGLNEYLKLGKGESDSGGSMRKAIVADAFEAFLGALYLDQGFSFTKKFILDLIVPYLKDEETSFLDDYKSKLQELVQTDKRTLKYVVVREEGPSHNKVFHVNVMIDDIVYGAGVAHSKKEAEQEAAKDAIKKSVK